MRRVGRGRAGQSRAEQGRAGWRHKRLLHVRTHLPPSQTRYADCLHPPAATPILLPARITHALTHLLHPPTQPTCLRHGILALQVDDDRVLADLGGKGADLRGVQGGGEQQHLHATQYSTGLIQMHANTAQGCRGVQGSAGECRGVQRGTRCTGREERGGGGRGSDQSIALCCGGAHRQRVPCQAQHPVPGPPAAAPRRPRPLGSA